LNPIRARSGQKVLIEMDDRRALFIAFMLYLVPLAGLVAGIILGLRIADILGWVGSREPAAAGIGLAAMALIFGGISLWDRRVKKSGRYRPVIAALVQEETSEGAAD
ncbi:MAG: SoxR reducing system RseC family protein, partial [Atribacterota bacterium]|nr:SoxR reducing system RseC family protein [Atribacterota bacterium]